VLKQQGDLWVSCLVVLIPLVYKGYMHRRLLGIHANWAGGIVNKRRRNGFLCFGQRSGVLIGADCMAGAFVFIAAGLLNGSFFQRLQGYL